MTTKTVPEIVFRDFIRRQIEERNTTALRFAKEVGVSHPTVYRWTSGQDLPRPKACLALASVTGESIVDVLKMAGHIPADYEPAQDLPSFRSYMRLKYPGILTDSILRMVEREIEHNWAEV